MTTHATPDMEHLFLPGASADARTCILLHGTGGDENDLVPLGRKLLPNAAILSLRGNVNENGMLRFFRRTAPGIFDLDDLFARTHEMDAFLQRMSQRYTFNLESVVFIGYSNGANIIASLMLLHPKAVRAAILFHPTLPYTPDAVPDLSDTQVFIGAGMQDPMVPSESTNALATLLHSAGAGVQVHWEENGHRMTDTEIEAARTWLRLHELL